MIRSTLLLGATLSLLAMSARAEMVQLHATMNAATEVPPKTTGGTGTVEATLDTTTKTLDYTGSWSGLSGPATMAHFHGPAAPGSNAGVAVPWGNSPANPFKGHATLTDAQVADLLAGKWYANVHTAQNPGGEIRGQVTRQ